MSSSHIAPIVYLAGPIKGLNYSEATDWRVFVEHQFDPAIMCLSPMRYKQWLREEGPLQDSYPAYTFGSDKGITTRDRLDVMRSDAVLVNFLGATDKSIGTCIELGWADAWRKPLIVVMEPDNIHDHAMVREIASYIVPTLDEARQVIYRLFLPEYYRG